MYKNLFGHCIYTREVDALVGALSLRSKYD